MRGAINWFEIPALDLARANAFHERILDTQMKADATMAFFACDRDGGATDLDAGASLARVPEAGGEVTLHPGMGWWALIVDSEGNRVGLHSEG
jgi:predicted enzyme related to lactoylglutathione lyase